MNLDFIRAKLAIQGAVLNDGSVISQIASALVLKMWTATPGMGVYYTAEEGIYRLELDTRYRNLADKDYEVGLPMYDERVKYLRHEYDARENRIMVYFEVHE